MTVAVLFVAALHLGASAAGDCPSSVSGSVNVLGNSCFEFVAKEMTWNRARSYCHSRGGRLAAVTAADRQAWISSQVETLLEDYDDVWIGLNDRETEGSFVWDNYDGFQDLASGYTNWKSGEPNNAWLGQNCVFLDKDRDWQWNDGECNLPIIRSNTFVCEYSIVLSSATSTLSSGATIASWNGSFSTNVAPSEVDSTSTVGAELTTQLLSSTNAVDATTSASERPSFLLGLTSTVALTLTKKVTVNEQASIIGLKADDRMSPAVGATPVAYASTSLSTSGDDIFTTNEATVEIYSSTRSAEAASSTPITYTTTSLWTSGDDSFATEATTVESHSSTPSATIILWQSSTDSASMQGEVPSHRSLHNTGSVIEIKATASQTYGANARVLSDIVLSTLPLVSPSTSATLSPSYGSLVTPSAPSMMLAFEKILTVRLPSSTALVTAARTPASYQPASIFSLTSATNALTTNISATELSPPVDSTLGDRDSSVTISSRTTHVPSSILTSSEGTLHAHPATAAPSPHSRSSESTAAFIRHSDGSNTIAPEAATSPSSTHGARNVTEREAAAVKTFDDNTSAWPGMPIYLSVLAATLLGVLIITAVLVTRRVKRRQPRPAWGIDNALYGAV